MSRYPGNPWWDHEEDAPLMIMMRGDWEEAQEGGYVTPEHVMQRLKNIVDHAFDNEGAMGFDEDGFVVSLVAEGLALPDGVKLYVYSNDHPPPHVHIVLKSHPEAKLRCNLQDGEFMDEPPKGVNTKKLRGFQEAIRENFGTLSEWWETYHGDPVVIS